MITQRIADNAEECFNPDTNIKTFELKMSLKQLEEKLYEKEDTTYQMADSLECRSDILNMCLSSWALASSIVGFMSGNNLGTLSLIKLVILFLKFLRMEYRQRWHFAVCNYQWAQLEVDRKWIIRMHCHATLAPSLIWRHCVRLPSSSCAWDGHCFEKRGWENSRVFCWNDEPGLWPMSWWRLSIHKQLCQCLPSAYTKQQTSLYIGYQ